MDYNTLLRLKRNPHYKMTAEQQRLLDEYDKAPMVQFGVPSIHNDEFVKHPGLRKIKQNHK